MSRGNNSNPAANPLWKFILESSDRKSRKIFFREQGDHFPCSGPAPVQSNLSRWARPFGKRNLQFLFINFTLFSLLWFPGACTSTENLETAGRILNKYISNPMIESDAISVSIATNRTGRSFFGCDNQSFSADFSDSLRYGECLVHTPADHPVGAVDAGTPGQKSDQLFADLGGKELLESDFFSSLQKSEAGYIIFVHGFNVLYQEALFRASQIKYDLKFPGKVILFTWPAGAQNSFLDQFMLNRTYSTNLRSAIGTRILFASFIRKISELDGPKYLIVHSMGHQVVIPVLAELSGETSTPIFKEIIFNAPDFPSEEFQQISSKIKQLSTRVTLYCSPNDNALSASSIVNQKSRAGSCVKATGVDVVNVQDVDSPVLGIGGLGHGYYSSRPILTDLYQVILGVEAPKRLFIRKAEPWENQNFNLRN